MISQHSHHIHVHMVLYIVCVCMKYSNIIVRSKSIYTCAHCFTFSIKFIPPSLYLVILEFITASPVLYKLMALLDDWDTSFTNQLQSHPSGPPSLFEQDQAGYGPAITRHKFILEPEHSPFKYKTTPTH